MTNEEAIDLLRGEIRCIKNNDCVRKYKCRECIYVLPEQELVEALSIAIKTLLGKKKKGRKKKNIRKYYDIQRNMME